MSMNTVVHDVVAIEGRTVETVSQLFDAIGDLRTTTKDMELFTTYRVELLQETLSDGSHKYIFQIRKALSQQEIMQALNI